jgi:hypothetical protein
MKRILIVVGLITTLVGVGYAFQAWKSLTVAARTRSLNEDVMNLFDALQKYKEHVGAYPTGGNVEVAKALKGQNPKNVIVLVGRKSQVNEKGEFVDPWNTPLIIYFSDKGIMVRSAGPNRRFDDSTVPECDDFFRSN